jgi:hypothetical protein
MDHGLAACFQTANPQLVEKVQLRLGFFAISW